MTRPRICQLNNLYSMLDRGKIFFIISKASDGGWVVHPAILPRVKPPGCKADHSPPSSAEVKNE